MKRIKNSVRRRSLLIEVFPLLTVLMLLFFVSSCAKSIEKPDTANPLLGAWEVKEVHWITKENRYSISPAQPGLFIFTPDSYSLMWIPSQEARVPFKVLSQPTDEEAAAGFRSVVFNAGSYQFTDTTITAKVVIAKVPGFEGGTQFYRYEIEDGILNLTMFDETYPDGSKPDWSGNTEALFVLEKVDK